MENTSKQSQSPTVFFSVYVNLFKTNSLSVKPAVGDVGCILFFPQYLNISDCMYVLTIYLVS